MDSLSAAQQNHRVRVIRDEYRKRERDLVVKHQQQLKRISQKYADDLEKMRQQTNVAMDGFREKAKRSLNDKDLFYQSQIRDLRVQSRRHLENELNSLKVEHRNQTQSLQTQMAKEKQINRLQEQRLKKTFAQEIERKDQIHEEIVSENARQSRLSLEKKITNLRKKHDNHARDIATDRDIKLAQKAEEMQAREQAAAKTLNDTRRLLKNRLNYERRTSQATLAAEREASRNINHMQRQAFRDGLQDVKERFQKTIEKTQTESQKARKGFEDVVNKRQRDRVGSLEARIIFLKKVHDGEKLKLRHELDRDRKILAKAYRNQVKGFDKNRRDLIDHFNKVNHGEIAEVVHKKDIHFKKQMRRMRDEMTTQNLINRQALEDLRTFHEERQVHVETQADRRVQSMNQELNRKLKAMDANFVARLETLKDDHQGALRDLRINSQEERNKLVRRFQNQSKEREKFYDNKIKDMKIHHKNDLELIKRDHNRQMKGVVDAKDRKFEVQRRAQEKQVDALKLYYEEKASDTRKSHEEEIQRLKQMHDEQVRKMIITTQRHADDRAKASSRS